MEHTAELDTAVYVILEGNLAIMIRKYIYVFALSKNVRTRLYHVVNII